MKRSRLFARGVALAEALTLTACATVPGAPPSATGTRSDATVWLLGEVHDNAALHRQRLDWIAAQVAAGWRPVLVMEQFDTDGQADIDRARQQRPRDAAHLIAAATPERSGWDWSLYQPLVQLALDHDLPLRAGNLSRDRARALVRSDAVAVFGAAQARAWGLDAVPQEWRAAQQQEVHVGHCGALPPDLLPGMARAQLARDAVMADVIRDSLRRYPGRGVVLITGNGHVRRDLGVPRWLSDLPSSQVRVRGHVETGEPVDGRYDEVLSGAVVERGDPCAAFKPAPRTER